MTTSTTTLPVATVRRLLTLRDLTDPAAGAHALQQAVDRIQTALATAAAVPCTATDPTALWTRDNSATSRSAAR